MSKLYFFYNHTLHNLYTAQVESVDVFYDEDEGTKLVMWNPPEGEVTAYSIRISYSENGFTRRQFSSSENPWIQLRLTDLPSQRPLWIEVLGFLKCFTNQWIKSHRVCVLTLPRSVPATLQDLHPGAAELNCVWTRKVSWPSRMLMHLVMHWYLKVIRRCVWALCRSNVSTSVWCYVDDNLA